MKKIKQTPNGLWILKEEYLHEFDMIKKIMDDDNKTNNLLNKFFESNQKAEIS